MLNFSNVESEKSFSPIKPGESVPVKLTKVEVTQDGDLDLHFQGTDVDNAGGFKPRFWASDLDSNSDRYNADKAENILKQIKQILEAYLDNNAIDKVAGNTPAQFFGSIQQALTPDVVGDVVANMKIVYKYNSDTLCVLPKYGSFISTAFRPRGLKLRTSTDNNNIPYERIEPLTVYGAAPDGGSAPSGGADLPFGQAAEEEVPFGN